MSDPGLIQSPKLAALSVPHGFTTREGGASDGPFASLNVSMSVGDDRNSVLSNRAVVLNALERPAARWVSVKQVHGDEVLQVTALAGKTIEADGLLTRDRGAAIAVLVADCVPILLADRTGEWVGVVHAGWRGTEKHIARQAVTKLAALGVEPEHIVAAVGPAIGPDAFEIGVEVRDALAAAYPREVDDALRQRGGGQFDADLWKLNVADLIAGGVPAGSIDVLRLCTHTRAEFYSHRRDKGQTGRQAAVILSR